MLHHKRHAGKRRGGERKEKLEEEEILHELAFHLLSRDGMSGEQCLLWQGQEGARAFTLSTLFPSIFTKEWRVLLCKEAAFCSLAHTATICFSVENSASANLVSKNELIAGSVGNQIDAVLMLTQGNH